MFGERGSESKRLHERTFGLQQEVTRLTGMWLREQSAARDALHHVGKLILLLEETLPHVQDEDLKARITQYTSLPKPKKK